MKPTLYYVYDPMCSWCWGFNKTWGQVKNSLPNSINVQYILGGLAPDSNEPMPSEMREYIQMNWRKIQQKIPDTEFNYTFWDNCHPRRSTYPACRAVIAVKNQKPELEKVIIKLIQQAYYLESKNPSEDDVLISLAKMLDIDITQFTQDLNSESTQQLLSDDIALTQSLGVSSFPSLVLKEADTIKPISIDYNNADFILNQIIT
ncbi:MAG TPA: DsbA family protein [Gammaproteobacteria bacterium]|nr:DsbA family protein [Gammaproteobacteria bacterium]